MLAKYYFHPIHLRSENRNKNYFLCTFFRCRSSDFLLLNLNFYHVFLLVFVTLFLVLFLFQFSVLYFVSLPNFQMEIFTISVAKEKDDRRRGGRTSERTEKTNERNERNATKSLLPPNSSVSFDTNTLTERSSAPKRQPSDGRGLCCGCCCFFFFLPAY